MTKDERFLVELYRTIQSTGGYVNPTDLGSELGYKDKLVHNILQGLKRANLVKQFDQNEIGLTDRGIEVARSLLHS